MTRLDALLVLPPMYQTGRMADYNPKEPMGLMCLASALRQRGLSVGILDADVMSMSIDETVTKIMSMESTVIGISTLQRALPSMKLIVDDLRKKGVASHICCGGFTATLSAKHILETVYGVDSVVIGEGEVIFADLVSAITSTSEWKHMPGIATRIDGSVTINRVVSKPDLMKLPQPARDLLGLCLAKTNYATVLASRGCYGVCTFCSNQTFEKASPGEHWRPRNPVDVVDEIEQLHLEHGVSVFKFNDPNLFGPGAHGRQHVITLCEELQKRNLSDLHLMGFCRSNDLDLEVARLMKSVGFERLLIGIESADEQILRFFRKGESLATIRQSISIMREVGISLVPGFMIFNPYTSLSTLDRDILFLEEYAFTPTLSKSLRIFDGTPMQGIMENEGRLIWRDPFEGYHEYLVDPTIAAIYMALKIIYVEWIDALRKNYQDQLWAIKKAPAFNQRKGFDALNQMIFHLELVTLKALISWVRDGFTHQDILRHVEVIKRRLIEVESLILSGDHHYSTFNAEALSVIELADRIASILRKKEFRTFPEKYRWKDD